MILFKKSNAQKKKFRAPKDGPLGTLSMKGNFSENFAEKIIKKEYFNSRLVLGLAAVIIAGGIILTINGFIGSTSWFVSILGIKSKLNDAPPGIILIIVGLIVAWISRSDIKLEK